MRTIKIKPGVEIIIDDEDYDRVSKQDIYCRSREGSLRITTWSREVRSTVSLGRFIMGEGNSRVSNKEGPFDFRRENLSTIDSRKKGEYSDGEEARRDHIARKKGLTRERGQRRKCLKCDNNFTSSHKGNRICSPCNQANEGGYDPSCRILL